MTNLNEAIIEHHAIALFREIDCVYAFGPEAVTFEYTPYQLQDQS
ncbi:hypothetical protein [Acidithiobacillus ferrivorans]|nr:hypothetical protein [Acidithiobacillus ferrivorans]